MVDESVSEPVGVTGVMAGERASRGLSGSVTATQLRFRSFGFRRDFTNRTVASTAQFHDLVVAK